MGAPVRGKKNKKKKDPPSAERRKKIYNATSANGRARDQGLWPEPETGQSKAGKRNQDSSDSEDYRKIKEVKAARTAAGTPPMLL